MQGYIHLTELCENLIMKLITIPTYDSNKMKNKNTINMIQLKNTFYLIGFFIVTLAISSCNSAERKKVAQSEDLESTSVQEETNYLVDDDVTIDWTAYKFTEKAKGPSIALS